MSAKTAAKEVPSKPALLAEVLDAYGGLERWRKFSTLKVTIVTGGELWGIKGLKQDAKPRRMTIDLRRERASIAPFGDRNWRTEFTPDRIAIMDRSGAVLAERTDPRAAFTGHSMTTPWDPLDRAYYNGYALWTYLTTPFLLTDPTIDVAEIAPLSDGAEIWRGLRATFPDAIVTHSREQDFYFGPDNLLRRQDYCLDLAGGIAVSQLVSDFTEVEGIRFPTQWRTYPRGDDLRPKCDPLLVSAQLSNFELR